MKIKYFLIIFFVISHACLSQSIELKKSIKNDSVFIDLYNMFLAPIEVKIKPLDSLKPKFKFNDHFIVNPKDTISNILVIPNNIIQDTSKLSIDKYVNFRATFGDPKLVKPDTSYLYALPFPKRKRYKIIQSFHGKFSHYKLHSKYAIDFGLKIGDTITAARNGTVIFVKEDSKKYGKTEKYIDYANKVKVLHDDGTIGEYVHLKFNGAFVNVGDKVSIDKPIGLTGLSGFTTTPHLHFVVYKERSISIPVFFKGYENKTLIKNKFYRRKI